MDTSCRRLLSELPRTAGEPITLQAGTAVPTLQEFRVRARWDQQRARDLLQRHLAEVVAAGNRRGHRRNPLLEGGRANARRTTAYLACRGKIDNDLVTVHVGVAKGGLHALLDAELYLPSSGQADLQRCRAAGIPDEVRYWPKWRIALDQLIRLSDQSITFDWLVFDEGYGAAVQLLRTLNLVGQRFVAEVPVNFAVADKSGGPTRRADQRLRVAEVKKGRRYRLAHQTVADSVWRASAMQVWVASRPHRLIVAIDEATAERKYILSNVTQEPLTRLLAVAFRRGTVAHRFRVGKQEAGLMPSEGRDYTGRIGGSGRLVC